MLPYHVAWGRGHRMAAGLLNPTVNIDAALETAREHDQGARKPSPVFPKHVGLCIGVRVASRSTATPPSASHARPRPVKGERFMTHIGTDGAFVELLGVL